MKKIIRILIPIFLGIAIIACSVWYLFAYDREFTRDVLLSCARQAESQGNHNIATWFYNCAYYQTGDNEAVAIELAEQYKKGDNYTKAEFTLRNAIEDGGGIDLYVALCKTYVEQDKLLDAVNMLNSITNEDIRKQLDAMRPAMPTASPEPGFYNQYVSVTINSDNGQLYVATDGEYPSLEDDLYTEPLTLADGENPLYALCVGDNGLVSPLAVFGYTVGGIIEKVNFADPDIESLIRSKLNLGDNTEVFTNDLWKITAFEVPKEATNYADLQHMAFLQELTIEDASAQELANICNLTNLTTLKITNTSVSDEVLSAISVMPNLKSLTLRNCGLSSISTLETAVNLEYLDISENTIRNISALSSAEKLKELYLQQNAIDNSGALAALSNLTKLDISYNSLTTIAPITSIATLTWLDASHNSITDLGNIDTLSALSYLSVSNNALKDISKISKCQNISELYIANNAITDITSLSNLVKLMYLDFSHNQVAVLPVWPKDCALVTINGSYNLIESLEALSGYENLNNVHMDYNEKISSVKELASCPVLIEVNVYATAVTDVTALTDQSIIVNFNPVKPAA